MQKQTEAISKQSDEINSARDSHELLPWKHVEPSTKRAANVMPFLTFPLLKACNFRCNYCGEGGELSASMKSQQETEEVIERIFRAYKLGVRKFRLTGGEPFLFKGFEQIVTVLNDLGVYTHINTNASYVNAKEDFLRTLQSNIHFAASLDSTYKENFDYIIGCPGYFEDTISGIEFLSTIHRLLRINMVVTKDNVHEIESMILFCKAQRCNLKLLDVVSVPLPFGDRQDLHVCFNDVERHLNEIAEYTYLHEYARAFGTPCRVYVVDGVHVTVKNTWNGSRYELKGICNGCEYYPCHEGLYDIFSLPDGRVVGCRWSDTSVAATNEANDPYAKEPHFDQALIKMAKIFQRAEWVGRAENEAMVPHPYFVTHSQEVQKKEALVKHSKRMQSQCPIVDGGCS